MRIVAGGADRSGLCGGTMSDSDCSYQLVINAPRQDVWQALTSTGRGRSWLYGTVTTSSWTVGERYEQRTEGGDLLIDGAVLVVDAPDRLMLGFHCHWDADVESETTGTLEYRLTELAPDRTSLEVIQAGLGPATFAACQESNAGIYAALKAALEG